MFDDLDPAPRDLVPPIGNTRAALELLAAHEGEEVTVNIPGEPILDADGNLVGMKPGYAVTAYLAKTRTLEDE